MHKQNLHERYLCAARTKRLSLDAQRSTAADVLLAAGMASQHDEKSRVALRFARLKSGDVAEFSALKDVAGTWLYVRSKRAGRARLKSASAGELASKVLFYWMNDTCRVCHGRGHPTMLNAPTLDTSRDCPACHATGREPVSRIVQPEYVDEARWLIDQLDVISHGVFHRMQKLLAK